MPNSHKCDFYVLIQKQERRHIIQIYYDIHEIIHCILLVYLSDFLHNFDEDHTPFEVFPEK